MQAPVSRLVCSTLCFRHLPLAAAAEAVLTSGLPACDLVGLPGYCPHFDPFDAASLSRAIACLRRLPLRVHRLQTSLLAADAPGQDAAEVAAAARRTLAAARALGAGGVVFGVGRAADRLLGDPAVLIAEAGGSWAPLVADAAVLGLTVSFEAPHKGSLVHTAREALALIDACRQRNAGLVFDVAHQLRAGLALPDAVRLLAGRIDHVHLRDQQGGRGVYPLGRGEVDFAALLGELDRSGYGGAFCLEFPDAAPTTAEIVGLLQDSIVFLRTRCSLS